MTFGVGVKLLSLYIPSKYYDFGFLLTSCFWRRSFLNTADSEIFARILFPRIELKDILVM